MEYRDRRPSLFVFGGLPGTGKSTLAKAIARKMSATYLRIDVIEQALRNVSGSDTDAGGAGYTVAYALAESNLLLGGAVVADSVNPIEITRNAWREVAAQATARIVEIETICSDRTEHRRRVETRTGEVFGLILPTWQQVIERTYENGTGHIL
jgi:predicted kinase